MATTAELASLAEQPASAQLATALRAKGYKLIGQYTVQVNARIETRLTYWSKGAQQLVMERITWADGSTHCDIYQPLTQSNSIAETIAAIP